MKTENRIIHKYMGKKWIEKPKYFNPHYDEDWNEIMPVVEKIIKHEYEDGDKAFLRTFGMLSDGGKMLVRFNRMPLFEAETLIQALFLAIVDFIELENELTNKT